MRALRDAKFAMTVNIKCRNYNICAKRAENKVKQSNLVYHLVFSRAKRAKIGHFNV